MAWDLVAVLSGRWPNFHRIPLLKTLLGELGPADHLYLINRPNIPILAKSEINESVLQIDPRLTVITPWLPVHDQVAYMHPLSGALNRYYLARQLKKVLRPEAAKALWIMHPSFINYIDIPFFDYVIYDCYDEYIYNDGLHPDRRVSNLLWRLEKQLFYRANYSFAAAQRVRDKKLKEYNLPKLEILSNPPSYYHFTPARKRSIKIPSDLEIIPEPRVAYIGGLKKMLDLDLLEYLSQELSDVSFVMIGSQEGGSAFERLKKCDNIYFLGSRPHAEIPAYLAGMKAGIVPYKVDSYTRTLSPYKAMEYLMSGLETVSSNIPELAGKFQNFIHISENHLSFAQHLKSVISRYPHTLSDEQLWDISLEKGLSSLIQRLKNAEEKLRKA